MHFYFSVNKVLIGDIILTSPTGDRTAILCCHPSHAVDRILVVLVVFFMIFCLTSLELLSCATSDSFVRLVSNYRSLNYL